MLGGALDYMPGDWSEGLPPLVSVDTRALIVGTLPGAASLACREYYAGARNAFWRLLSDILDMREMGSYAERVRSLCASQLGLWDVFAAAARPGSLDRALSADSAIPNDFRGLFKLYPQVERIYFNGTASRKFFDRIGALRHPEVRSQRELVVLPSSSGACAMPYADKRAKWEQVKQHLKR